RTVYCRLGSVESLSGKDGGIQWVHPDQSRTVEPLPQLEEAHLFLAGLIWTSSSLPELVKEILSSVNPISISNKSYGDLALITENAAGCFINEEMLVVWV